ncbi:hypothetical protein BJH93_02670 [Kocuria polaris]|nr:hypothetical protein [Kocuria polaris]
MTDPTHPVTTDDGAAADARRPAALADLAWAICDVARKISDRGFDDPAIVPLSPLEVMVISRVHRQPGVTPSRLAELLRLKPSNASAALRALEAKGMVRRAPDPDDRRSTHVFATELAEDSTRRVRAEMSRLLAPLGLDTAQVRTLADALQDLEGHLPAAGTREH